MSTELAQVTRRAPFRGVDLFPPLDLRIDRRSDGTLMLRCGELGPVPATISAVLARHAAERGSRTFLAERDGTGEWAKLSYAEVYAAADAIAAWLGEHGFGPHTPLLIVTGNSTAHALLMFGAMAAGVPVCPVSAQYALPGGNLARLRHVVGLVRPALVFAEEIGPIAGALRNAGIGDGQTVIARDADNWSDAVCWDDVVGHPPSPDPDAVVAGIDPDAPAKYMLTSGSTGLPKVVIHTHRGWCTVAASAVQNIGAASGWGERTLDWMPWSHVAGISVMMGALFSGGTYYLDDGKPTPALFPATLRNLADVQPYFFANVPFAFTMLCDALEADPLLRERFFKHLQLCLYGGAALSQPVYDRFQAMAVATVGERVMFTSGYGATETTAGVMVMTWPTEKIGIGLPGPGITLKLVPLGDRYEIRFGGDALSPGYLLDPVASAKARDEEGFYRTGDTAVFDNPGAPERGLLFAGRLAEEFKLSSGTWVIGGRLRAEVVTTASPVVLDALICGENRDSIGLLLWLSPAGCEQACGVTGSMAELARDPQVLSWIAQRLAEGQRAASSSNRVERFCVLMDPPNADQGEMSDKGSINQAISLRRRAADVERLYTTGEPGVVVVQA